MESREENGIIIEFLLGSAPNEGTWFGDTKPNSSPFWWRDKLRKYDEDFKEQNKALLDKIKSLEDSLLDVTRKSCARIDELKAADSVNEQLQFQYNELEKVNGNLKTQVDSLVHCITHLEKDKIPIVINSKHCNCREPKIYRKWGEVGCDKCGKLLNPNQSLT